MMSARNEYTLSGLIKPWDGLPDEKEKVLTNIEKNTEFFDAMAKKYRRLAEHGMVSESEEYTKLVEALGLVVKDALKSAAISISTVENVLHKEG